MSFSLLGRLRDIYKDIVRYFSEVVKIGKIYKWAGVLVIYDRPGICAGRAYSN